MVAYIQHIFFSLYMYCEKVSVGRLYTELIHYHPYLFPYFLLFCYRYTACYIFILFIYK